MKRTTTVIVKMSEEEKDILREAAHKNGETMSNYLRRLLITTARKED